MKQRNKRGLIGALGASVAAAALALSGAVAASADQLPTIPLPAADAKGNLNITKFDTPSDGADAHNGQELDSSALSGLDPVSGVVFEVKQVTNVDLSTNAGWTKAQATTLTIDPLTLVPTVTVPSETTSYGAAKWGETNSSGVPQAGT